MRTQMAGMALATALLGVACGSSTKGQKTPPDEKPPDVHQPITESKSKQSGRLNLGQLRASFPVVMGNDAKGNPITWNSGNSQKPKNGFDDYAETLGEADFINRTEDDLAPSPIYVKFMDDAARSACNQTLSADLKQTSQSQRTLMRYVSPTDTPSTNAEGFRKNLAYLKLRFHGIKVTDDTQLTPLQTLFTNAGKSSSTPVEDGWRAVCVALLAAPEFHLY